ncbi:transposase [Aphanizomenon sp. PH219]|nr:transposase [Aphanizomenon sp. 202]MDK2458593.1 transposase [Aphanizomenon sp. PH219]
MKNPRIQVLQTQYQKCNRVQDHAKGLGIQLFCLPSSSPQLNLIERFWKFIRNECLYSKYYSNFTEFNGAISNCINTANTDKQEKLDSLLSFNCLEYSYL